MLDDLMMKNVGLEYINPFQRLGKKENERSVQKRERCMYVCRGKMAEKSLTQEMSVENLSVIYIDGGG